MKGFSRSAAATAVMVAGLAWVGLVAANEVQAQPGPFPQWCPGDSWDPTWGPNSDWNRCHTTRFCHCLHPAYRDIILAAMADRGALATLPALASPVHRVDQAADPAVVTTPVDLVDQAAHPAEADRVDPAAHPAEAVSAAAGADLAAAVSAAEAVAAEAVAGDATWLGVHGRSQRQQPRRGPQILLPEATF